MKPYPVWLKPKNYLFSKRKSVMTSANNSNGHQEALPLKQLLEDLQSLPADSFLTVHQGMLILAALERHQRGIVSLAELVDSVLTATENDYSIQHNNFMSLLAAVEQLAAMNGVSIGRKVTVENKSPETTEAANVIPFPTNKTKH